MAANARNQKSDHSKVWFDLAVTDNGDDTIDIAAGDIWVHDVKYTMSALVDNSVGTGPFRVWIEDLGGGSAGYKTDTALDDTVVPTSFGAGIGALLVAWKDSGDTDVIYLKSIQE